MAELLETLACYIPTLVVRRLIREPSPPTTPKEDRLPASMLFADLSGFTVLAEQLAQQGPEGAEELSDFLNSKFDRLITIITALGGDVVTFAGDALLALWPALDGDLDVMTHRAAQCGLDLQALFNNERLSASLHLDVRIGIGAGDVGIIHVGGVYERWLWLVTGNPVSQLIHVEQQAQPGQVVLSPEAWELVKHACAGEPLLEQPACAQASETGQMELARGESESEYLNHPAATPPSILLHALQHFPPAITPTPLALHPSMNMEMALRCYIPDVVLTRLAAGQGNWLAELRLITVLFVNLPEMHNSRMSLDAIQMGIRSLQTALYRYEGSVNKLSLDEKGTILIAVFGLPPLAHEDDALRGIQAAMEVQKDLQALGIRCSIGVTTGRAFCGIVGNDQRREYTILGDVVNLAARLMQATPDGILCDTATYQATRSRLVFDELAPISVKGKTDVVAVYRPRGLAEHVIQSYHVLIDRVEEQALLAAQLQALRRRKSSLSKYGEASVLIIEGEAGIGKSRLMHGMRQQAENLGILTLVGESDAIDLSTPYYAWRKIFAHLLEIEREPIQEKRQQLVLNTFASEPEMLRQIPLLNAVLPLDFPPNAYTSSLSGQAMADTTRSFLLDLFQLMVSATPTLLVIEDVQWLDSASWSLVLAVSQHIGNLLLTLTTRPPGDSPSESYVRLRDAPQTHYLVLSSLSAEDTYALVCQRLGVARAPESVASLIHEKAQGNPFFIEELAYALRDSGDIFIRDEVCWIAPETGDLQALSLPDTTHGVITSRIDRLTPAQQLTLKVASVIGYSFGTRTLHEVYPVEADQQEISNNLAMLERRELILPDTDEEEPAYRFKNAITHEVVYHLMPFAQRRQLHRAVGEWYLQTYADRLDEFAPVLAKHFDYADDPRAQKYYTLAGNEAYTLYANTEAIAHFGRALEIAHHHQAKSEHFIYLYLRCGRILEIQAEYEQALEKYQELQQLAEQQQDNRMKLAALMALATLRSTPNPAYHPQKAEELLEQALELARDLQDRIAESKILWNLMLLKTFTSNDPQQAVSYGEQSLALAKNLNLREQVALTLNDLSLAYRNSGKLERSQEVLEEASAMWRNTQNLPMLIDNLSRYAVGHFLLGHYEEAIASSEEAAGISESIGNTSGLANSRLIVGHVFLEEGRPDKAIAAMSEAIFQGEQVGHLTVQIGTRADLAWLYGMLGEIEHGIVLAEVACARSEEHNNLLRSWPMAVLARLLILTGDLAEAEKAIGESYQTYKERNEMLLAPIYVPLADAELALARCEYERAASVTAKLLSYLHDYQIRPFRADAHYLQCHALLGLGRVHEARQVLHKAYQEARSLGSQRTLWQILFLLSHIEACYGDVNHAGVLLQRARSMVQYIADHCGDEDLRTTFVHLPQVRVVVGKHVRIGEEVGSQWGSV